MKRAKQVLKNHFGDHYPKLEKWEFFNHIVNAMVDYKNEPEFNDMLEAQGSLDIEAPAAWKDVLIYLNKNSGHKYRFVKAHERLINARLKEGYTIQDLKKVVDTKAAEWKDTKQALYLRPSTLFNASKIDGYLNQAAVKSSTGDDNFNFNPSDDAELC